MIINQNHRYTQSLACFSKVIQTMLSVLGNIWPLFHPQTVQTLEETQFKTDSCNLLMTSTPWQTGTLIAISLEGVSRAIKETLTLHSLHLTPHSPTPTPQCPHPTSFTNRNPSLSLHWIDTVSEAPKALRTAELKRRQEQALEAQEAPMAEEATKLMRRQKETEGGRRKQEAEQEATKLKRQQWQRRQQNS